MSLRTTFLNVGRTATRAFGDIPENCTFHKQLYGADGQPSGTQTLTDLKAFRMDFTTEKVDNVTILKQDRQYLIAAYYFGGVEPKEDDILDFGGDEQWTVHLVQTDPAGASHLLHCRK